MADKITRARGISVKKILISILCFVVLYSVNPKQLYMYTTPAMCAPQAVGNMSNNELIRSDNGVGDWGYSILMISSPNHAVPMHFAEAVTPKKNFRQDPLFASMQDSIDADNETLRCQRYGLTYTPGAKRRRIFYASLVASDSMDVLRVHATEMYNMYHAVALLESNTTFMDTPRKLRFAPGLEMFEFVTSGIFGNQTKVFTDFWLDEEKEANNMMREAIMRESLIYRWRQQGMTSDDIGVVGDIDEFFSRDYLRAIQVCNVPEFNGTVCEKPKIIPSSFAYESSPLCYKQVRWYHPDLILGACLDGIGDPTGRIVAERRYHRTRGDRVDGYLGRAGGYRPEHATLGRYPLWTTQDYRSNIGALDQKMWPATNWAVAFHLHNFFEDVQKIRHKYATYGHGNHGGIEKNVSLSKLADDLDVVVRCVHELPNSVSNVTAIARIELPYDEIEGPKPIYFSNATYRQYRHEYVRKMVLEDEAMFGSEYTKLIQQQKPSLKRLDT